MLRVVFSRVATPKLAAQSDKEGWPAARFLAALAEHEAADRTRLLETLADFDDALIEALSQTMDVLHAMLGEAARGEDTADVKERAEVVSAELQRLARGQAPQSTDLLDSIGAQGKYARLRRLKRYWVSQVAGDPRFTFLAKPDSPHTGALQSVEIAGRDSRAVWTHLFRRGLNLGIHPYVENPDLRSGIFVAPHLFTRLADLDRLVAALRDVANNGVPI